MTKKNKQGQPNAQNSFTHLDLDTVNANASMDCTGLIPAAPASEAEKESYKELYDYEAEPPKKRSK